MGEFSAVDHSLINLICKQDCFQFVYNTPLSDLSCDKKITIVFLRVLFAIPTITLALLDIPICLGRTIFRLFSCSFTCENLAEFPRHMVILLVSLPLLLGIVLKPLLPFKKKWIDAKSKPPEGIPQEATTSAKTGQPSPATIETGQPPSPATTGQPPSPATLGQPPSQAATITQDPPLPDMTGWAPMKKAKAGFYGAAIKSFVERNSSLRLSVLIERMIGSTTLPPSEGGLLVTQQTLNLLKDLIASAPEHRKEFEVLAWKKIIENLININNAVNLNFFLEQQLKLLTIIPPINGEDLWSNSSTYTKICYWIMGLKYDESTDKISLETRKMINGNDPFEDSTDLSTQIVLSLLEKSGQKEFLEAFKEYILMLRELEMIIKATQANGKDPYDSVKKEQEENWDGKAFVLVATNPFASIFKRFFDKTPKTHFIHMFQCLIKRARLVSHAVTSGVQAKIQKEILASDTCLSSICNNANGIIVYPGISIVNDYYFCLPI